MNKSKDLVNPKNKILNYYCVNHHYKSKLVKNQKKCNSKIQFSREKEEFYLIEGHSAECNINKTPKFNEIKVINVLN